MIASEWKDALTFLLVLPIVSSSSTSSWSMKTLIKEYGPTALIAYQLISTTSLSLWFMAVHYGMDTDEAVERISGWKETILRKINFVSSFSSSEPVDCSIAENVTNLSRSKYFAFIIFITVNIQPKLNIIEIIYRIVL